MNRPNILWLMTDEQRCDSLGFYGSEWAKTPNLDKLASEAIVFMQAITPAPVSAPARTSMLTGKYPSQTNTWYNQKATENLNHLTFKFKDVGYDTASFGKQHYTSINKAFDVEENDILSEAVNCFKYSEEYDEKDFDVIKYSGHYPWIFGGTFPDDTENTSEALTTKKAIDWLEKHDKHNPFFLRVSFNGPHTPVAPPAPYDKIISPDDIDTELNSDTREHPDWISDSLMHFSSSSRMSNEDIKKARAYYYGQVSYLDSLFGNITDWLDNNNMLEDTIIIFVSDHGTHMGDYGLVQKQTFYQPVVAVPCFIWYPKSFASSVKISTPIEARLLLPSIMEYLNLGDFTEETYAETLVSGINPPVKPVFSEFTLGSFDVRHDDKLCMVQLGDWKLSLCILPDAKKGIDGTLHNLNDDPNEENNLYYNCEYKKIVNQLSELILSHLFGNN